MNFVIIKFIKYFEYQFLQIIKNEIKNTYLGSVINFANYHWL